jgi:DNA-binding response OmpR family regulator
VIAVLSWLFYTSYLNQLERRLAYADCGMLGEARPAGRSSPGLGSARERRRLMAEHPAGLRVLVVDDDPAMAGLVQGILKVHGYPPPTHAATGRDALGALDQVDVVLLDHQLPDSSGLEVLDAIRGRANPPAVVLVTAHGSESLAAMALRQGADDYLAKDAALPALLPQILERVRRSRELRKALVAAEQELVRSERLRAIGEMTITLHHEINNPLMSASADLELLLAEPNASPEASRQVLLRVGESLGRIRDIIRRIGELREVRTKSYVPGVRMVDLENGKDLDSPGLRGTAILLLADEDLARIVSLLLRGAGFRVERQQMPLVVREVVAQPAVTLVLVMGGTDAAGAHPLGGFDPPVDRGYRVVALVTGDGAAARAAGADQVIQLPFDPDRFAEEIGGIV